MLRLVFSLVLAALLLGLGPAWGLSRAYAQPNAQTTPPVNESPGVPSPAITPQPETAILTPFPGQALQGNVTISGQLPSSGFQAAELDFGYPADPTGTWFLIAEFAAPLSAGPLAQWDTTTLSDGIYTLRLLVTRTDGSRQEMRIPGLRVRNYTAIETDTPTPIPPTAALQPGLQSEDTPLPVVTRTRTPTQTLVPSTATQLPPNPGILRGDQIQASLGRGALGAAGFFALLGLYAAVRRLSKPK